MPDIFLSYRRKDSASATGRLADRLVEHFGAERVFHDHASILAGDDFAEAIRRAIGESTVVLAVVGPDWLDARDDLRRRRLDDPADLVRLELEAALDAGKPLVPVLVEGATMMPAAQLPASLAAFTRCQAVELSDGRWRYDSDRLLALLQSRYAIESERPPLVIAPEDRLALGWPGRLALDLLDLATHPTRLIGRRQTGRAIDHLRAFAFLLVCLGMGNALLLLGLDRYTSWREATNFAGFVAFTTIFQLLLVTLLSTPLTLAWRLAGVQVEFRQVTLIFAYLVGGAWLGLAAGWMFLGVGMMLADGTLFDRVFAALAGRSPGAAASFAERVAQAQAVAAAGLAGPAKAAMVIATLAWIITAAWAVVAWGSFRQSFGVSRVRAVAATALWLAMLAAIGVAARFVAA